MLFWRYVAIYVWLTGIACLPAGLHLMCGQTRGTVLVSMLPISYISHSRFDQIDTRDQKKEMSETSSWTNLDFASKSEFPQWVKPSFLWKFPGNVF